MNPMTILLTAAVATTAVLPGLALAHPAKSMHAPMDTRAPDEPGLTRKQVLCELEAARKDGSLRSTQRRRASTYNIPPAPQCSEAK